MVLLGVPRVPVHPVLGTRGLVLFRGCYRYLGPPVHAPPLREFSNDGSAQVTDSGAKGKTIGTAAYNRMGPQLVRAVVVHVWCVLDGGSLASLFREGCRQEPDAGEQKEWPVCPSLSCQWRWLGCSCCDIVSQSWTGCPYWALFARLTPYFLQTFLERDAPGIPLSRACERLPCRPRWPIVARVALSSSFLSPIFFGGTVAGFSGGLVPVLTGGIGHHCVCSVVGSSSAVRSWSSLRLAGWFNLVLVVVVFSRRPTALDPVPIVAYVSGLGASPPVLVSFAVHCRGYGLLSHHLSLLNMVCTGCASLSSASKIASFKSKHYTLRASCSPVDVYFSPSRESGRMECDVEN
ncbi:hypothetical protein Taro_022827 [Colocasia esculenta]|uniref:Uncharacterized protein n=1 Tax=Colocasia esculenta TaxID=4460 RepID=A0A843UVI2_COLES|nr:hypothetical protein [Colocasia esculenta]